MKLFLALTLSLSLALPISYAKNLDANLAPKNLRHVEYPTYYAHVNGVNLAYQDFGANNKETILLIMGLGGQLIHWEDDFVLDLVQQGYRVIRFDNRDVGWSSKLHSLGKPGLFTLLRYKLGLPLGAPYKLDDMAADSMALLDYLRIEQAHVVGASMGGMIAQIMAANYPRRVATLTSIMSTSGDESLPQSNIQPSLDNFREQSRNSVILAKAKFAQLIDGNIGEPSHSEWIDRMARAYDRAHYSDGAARQLWAIGDSGDRVELLRTIKQPSLVVHGTADPLVPVEGGKHTAELIPNAELVLLEGMGHFIDPVSQPKILAAMLAMYEENKMTNQTAMGDSTEQAPLKRVAKH